MAGSDDTYKRLPVRIVYSGEGKKPDGSVQKFTTVYDFHDFQTSINGDWAFKV
jgi:hypothetical protein